MKTTTTIEAALNALATRSSMMWEAAVESAERDGQEEKVRRCQEAASDCRSAWQSAVEALTSSETRHIVVQEIRFAELIARSWGDSSPEREALLLLT